MMCFQVKGSAADTQVSDSDEASPGSSEQARKLRPQRILCPSHNQFLTSGVPSSLSSLLFSPQRASASYCLLGFSSAEQLFRRIVAFPFLPASVLPRELPPPILLWPTAFWATQIKKKQPTQFVFGTTSAKRGGGGAGCAKVTV